MEFRGIDYRYSLRESLNIYAGLTIGGAATLALFRYSVFGSIGADPGVWDDALAWVGATAASLIPMIPDRNFPLPIIAGGAAMGGWIGMHGAEELRDVRIKRETLERK